MSQMNLQESWERFEEGMKRAADRAEEISRLQENKKVAEDWRKTVFGIRRLLEEGRGIYRAKAISHQRALEMLDAERDARIAKEEKLNG